MAGLRNASRRNYTTIANDVFRDYDLSLRATGLLCKMLALPPDWNFSVQGLMSLCSDGKNSVQKSLKELEAGGYLIRAQKRSAGGTWASVEYVIFDNKDDRAEVVAELMSEGYAIVGFVNQGVSSEGVSESESLDPESSTDSLLSEPNAFVNTKPQVRTGGRNTAGGDTAGGSTAGGISAGIINNLIIKGDSEFQVFESSSPSTSNSTPASDPMAVSDLIPNLEPASVPISVPDPEPLGESADVDAIVDADTEADDVFNLLCISAVNRNKLRGADGLAETRKAYDALLAKGYAADEIERAWSETQEEAKRNNRRADMYPQLCAWLRSSTANGQKLVGAAERIRLARRTLASSTPRLAKPSACEALTVEILAETDRHFWLLRNEYLCLKREVEACEEGELTQGKLAQLERAKGKMDEYFADACARDVRKVG